MSDADEKVETGGTPEATTDFFVFEIDSELYAVPVLAVDQVMRIPPITGVPNASDAVVGIFHMRGKVVVALDIMRCLGLPREHMLSSFYLFTTHNDKNHYAILVDEPKTLAHVPISKITPPDPLLLARIKKEYISGVFLYENQHLSKKAENSFLIEPASTHKDEGESKESKKPVAILDLSRVLSEENVRGELTTIETTSTPYPHSQEDVPTQST